MNLRKRLGRLGRQAKGCRDYYLNTSLRNVWGGPFNGQEVRQSVFAELAKQLDIQNAVETGTYLGDTTGFISSKVKGIVYSIESNPYNTGFARARFLLNPRIRVKFGDSRMWLRRLLAKSASWKGVTFFYLDAHWNEELPLADELNLIFASGIQASVMVDDFQVIGDSGYAFDDYGPHKKLTISYIREIVNKYDLACFFPSSAAANETGARRGYVLIVRKDLAGDIQHLASFQQV